MATWFIAVSEIVLKGGGGGWEAFFSDPLPFPDKWEKNTPPPLDKMSSLHPTSLDIFSSDLWILYNKNKKIIASVVYLCVTAV